MGIKATLVCTERKENSQFVNRTHFPRWINCVSRLSAAACLPGGGMCGGIKKELQNGFNLSSSHRKAVNGILLVVEVLRVGGVTLSTFRGRISITWMHGSISDHALRLSKSWLMIADGALKEGKTTLIVRLIKS